MISCPHETNQLCNVRADERAWVPFQRSTYRQASGGDEETGAAGTGHSDDCELTAAAGTEQSGARERPDEEKEAPERGACRQARSFFLGVVRSWLS